VILSFDVEEHDRIEAATALSVRPALKTHYRARLEPSTRWLLEQLESHDIEATFFIVGQIAHSHPELVRAIHRAGHEVGSHGWDHRRVLAMAPGDFREDVRRSKDALEQITGEPVLGYRAPTFSIVRKTGWALDVLAELGLLYDSSIYPVRHDRYGVSAAPRAPFRARGLAEEMLEIPPATLRLLGMNFPMGGGGYFRIFPLFFLEHALWQTQQSCCPSVAMLYFHPWEFDPRQARLPLGRLSSLRTYMGIGRSRARLAVFLKRHRFTRAIDVARQLDQERHALATFSLTEREYSARDVLLPEGSGAADPCGAFA
jgi:polysaccharide deacetylase family protein (PEP-CTERM system associated)